MSKIKFMWPQYPRNALNHNFIPMPRQNSSRSRSRSPKRMRRYNRDSQDSDRAHRKKSRYDQPPKNQPKKLKYDLQARSDIKNHIRYDNVAANSRREEEKIMEAVQGALRKEFGGIEHVTKVDSSDNAFSFVVGFKYDRDAYNYIKQEGSIYISFQKLKLYPKPTPVFEECIPLIKQARKQQKTKERSPSPPKRRNHPSPSSQKNHKKKKERSRDRRDSRSPQRNDYKKKNDEKLIWIFGLPSSLKGKEVIIYLQKHPAGPFLVNSWKWMRVKESNCEYMEVSLDAKKAEKLLSLRQQHSIQGFPCIITNSSYDQGPEGIKNSLKQFQFRITYPQKINPASLYKILNQTTKVVQMVSCSRLEDGRSDAFTVTVGSASKARDIKRLSLRQTGIRVEDGRGQLVYRPTKHSKLTDNQ